jgi:hypothetical protein
MIKSCDTMVALGNATKDGQTIFAKNSDRPSDECQPLVQRQRLLHPADAMTQCQFVKLPEVSAIYRHVGSRPYWCWGYEHGFNEHQVKYFLFFLLSFYSGFWILDSGSFFAQDRLNELEKGKS